MTSIFVGNLPYTVNEVDLRRLFESHGRVAGVQIMMDAATNRSRGFAFVRMPVLDDAEEAIACLSRASMNGRQLTVNEARQNASRTSDRAHENSARRSALDLFHALQSD